MIAPIIGRPAPAAPATPPLDLDAIEARANAALDGEWRLNAAREGVSGFEDGCLLWAECGDDDEIGQWFGDVHGAANAEFIAHARTDVPALCAEVRALRERVAYLDRRLASARASLHTLADVIQQQAEDPLAGIREADGPETVPTDSEGDE